MLALRAEKLCERLPLLKTAPAEVYTLACTLCTLKFIYDPGSDSVEFRYDPRGNRVYKAVSEGETITQEIRYIVDIVGKLPVILCEIDVTDPNCSLKNRYYYTNSQILAQDIHNDPNYAADFDRYFYLHVEDPPMEGPVRLRSSDAR